jgi:hypothetical protein
MIDPSNDQGASQMSKKLARERLLNCCQSRLSVDQYFLLCNKKDIRLKPFFIPAAGRSSAPQ